MGSWSDSVLANFGSLNKSLLSGPRSSHLKGCSVRALPELISYLQVGASEMTTSKQGKCFQNQEPKERWGEPLFVSHADLGRGAGDSTVGPKGAQEERWPRRPRPWVLASNNYTV